MDQASGVLLALRPVTFRYKPEIDPVGTPAVRPRGRRSGKGEPRPSGSRRRWKTLHRALRPGERDVAKRVPERAQAFLARTRKSQEQQATITHAKERLRRYDRARERLEAVMARLNEQARYPESERPA